MIKRLIERLVNKDEAPPEPLKPGQSVDGSFELKDRGNGKRYDMVKALQRSYQVQEARRRLGLDEDEQVRLPEDYFTGPVPKVVQEAQYQPTAQAAPPTGSTPPAATGPGAAQGSLTHQAELGPLLPGIPGGEHPAGPGR